MSEPSPAAPSGLAVRRWRDARRALAVGSVILLLPVTLALADRGVIAGVPTLVIFVFATWFAGIMLTRLLARRLPDG